jgi:hypothetical protein
MFKKAYCSTLAALTLIILFYKNVEIFKKINKSLFSKKKLFVKDENNIFEYLGIFLFSHGIFKLN